MPVDKFGRMPKTEGSKSDISLNYINNNFLKRGEIDMFGEKITNLGTPTDAGDAAPKSFVIRRINKIAKDYDLENLKQIKTDIIERMRKNLEKYIDKEKLEAELNKLKKEWALDDKTSEDEITQKIMKDIEKGVNILKNDLKDLVDEKNEETLQLVVDRMQTDIGEVIAGRNKKIRQLEKTIRDLKDNQPSILLFSLEISKDTVIKVYQDSLDEVHIADEKGKQYGYLTKAFVMLPNEHIKYDEIVEYLHILYGAPELGWEYWILKKPGVYTFDIDLKFKSSVPDHSKQMFAMTFDDGRERICSEEQGGCKKVWTFNIDKPRTHMIIKPLAYKVYAFTEKGYIKLYYKPS